MASAYLTDKQQRRQAERFRLSFVVFALLLSFASSALALCGSEVFHSKQTAERIDREWPVRTAGDTVSAYLQSLGQRLAPHQDVLAVGSYFTYDWPSQWLFRAVRDTSVNAFSIGDGRTYINDGVILAAESELQVAAILAHEMGHQLATHFCSNGDERGAPSRRIGSLSQAMDLSKEIEADRMALEILATAGYPPQAMLDAISKMPISDPNAQRQRQQRIQALRRELADYDTIPAPPSSAAFAATKAFLQRQ